MRRFAVVLPWVPLLSGCFLFPSGESSRVGDVPEELKKSAVVAPAAADRHAYGGVARLKAGQWARYREGGAVLTLAVAGKEAGGVWVEVIEEGEPRLVSARLVTPEGVVKKAFYAEVSKDSKTAAVPQDLRQWAGPAPALREASREGIEERVAVGGRDLAARGARVRSEDAEGRLVEEVSLWHPDVPPVYAGSDLGGLVRRRSGARAVELLDFGGDAKPLITVLPGAAEAQAAKEDRAQEVIDEVEKISVQRGIRLLAPEKAGRLAELVRKAKPRLVVEGGTAIGYSGLWIARELKAAGGGRLITLEIDPALAREAEANFRKAGLADCVTVKVGDARKLVKDIEGPIDFVFLDCHPPNYYPCFLGLEGRLRPGAVVVADNAGYGASGMADYTRHVRAKYNSRIEWFDINLPWSKRDAIEVTVIEPPKAKGP